MTLSGGNTILSGGKTGLPVRNAEAVLLEGTVCTLVGLAAVVVAVVGEEGGGEEVVEVGLETLTGGCVVGLLCKKLDFGAAAWLSFLLPARVATAAASPAAAPAALTAASEAASVLGVVVMEDVVMGTGQGVVAVVGVVVVGVVGLVLLFSFTLCELEDDLMAEPGARAGEEEVGPEILDLAVLT